MQVAKLEAFLKAQLTGDFFELALELDDHKSCYCTASDYEDSYKNITVNWANEEERRAAYTENKKWDLDKWGYADKSFTTISTSSIEGLLRAFGVLDQDTITQANALSIFLHSLMKGEFSSASIRYLTGMKVGRVGEKETVYSLDNVATMVAEDENYSDLSDWISQEDRDKAVANNGIWTLQWYPNTPVGFCTIHGSSLQVLVDSFN